MATKTCNPDPLWRWKDSLDEGLRDKLTKAVEETWAYARFSTWSYLHDESMAAEIMEEALDVVRDYALRCSPPPTVEKLTGRLFGQFRRITKRKARRLQKEYAAGSLRDLALYSPVVHDPDPTDILLLKQVLELLPPQAREVAEWIRMGYSWREIGKTFDVDHNALRFAFRCDVDAALIRLGRGIRICRQNPVS